MKIKAITEGQCNLQIGKCYKLHVPNVGYTFKDTNNESINLYGETIITIIDIIFQDIRSTYLIKFLLDNKMLLYSVITYKENYRCSFEEVI